MTSLSSGWWNDIYFDYDPRAFAPIPELPDDAPPPPEALLAPGTDDVTVRREMPEAWLWLETRAG